MLYVDVRYHLAELHLIPYLAKRKINRTKDYLNVAVSMYHLKCFRLVQGFVILVIVYHSKLRKYYQVSFNQEKSFSICCNFWI